MLACTEGSVKQHLARAKARLQKTLGRWRREHRHHRHSGRPGSTRRGSRQATRKPPSAPSSAAAVGGTGSSGSLLEPSSSPCSPASASLCSSSGAPGMSAPTISDLLGYEPADPHRRGGTGRVPARSGPPVGDSASMPDATSLRTAVGWILHRPARRGHRPGDAGGAARCPTTLPTGSAPTPPSDILAERTVEVAGQQAPQWDVQSKSITGRRVLHRRRCEPVDCGNSLHRYPGDAARHRRHARVRERTRAPTVLAATRTRHAGRRL